MALEKFVNKVGVTVKELVTKVKLPLDKIERGCKAVAGEVDVPIAAVYSLVALTAACAKERVLSQAGRRKVEKDAHYKPTAADMTDAWAPDGQTKRLYKAFGLTVYDRNDPNTQNGQNDLDRTIKALSEVGVLSGFGSRCRLGARIVDEKAKAIRERQKAVTEKLVNVFGTVDPDAEDVVEDVEDVEGEDDIEEVTEHVTKRGAKVADTRKRRAAKGK